ncbi:hypothetical protein, partial [Phreatobacter sp.]|uniref:hypothetical protein n=1 Tax=Phreatobacter sp. TaxID=1966341 RepID=UPI0025DA1F28
AAEPATTAAAAATPAATALHLYRFASAQRAADTVKRGCGRRRRFRHRPDNGRRHGAAGKAQQKKPPIHDVNLLDNCRPAARLARLVLPDRIILINITKRKPLHLLHCNR